MNRKMNKKYITGFLCVQVLLCSCVSTFAMDQVQQNQAQQNQAEQQSRMSITGNYFADTLICTGSCIGLVMLFKYLGVVNKTAATSISGVSLVAAGLYLATKSGWFLSPSAVQQSGNNAGNNQGGQKVPDQNQPINQKLPDQNVQPSNNNQVNNQPNNNNQPHNGIQQPQEIPQQKPRCKRPGCNNNCYPDSQHGGYFDYCGKTCANLDQQSNNQVKKKQRNNKKQQQIPQCKLPGCNKNCCSKQQGGYYDYCCRGHANLDHQNNQQQVQNNRVGNTIYFFYDDNPNANQALNTPQDAYLGNFFPSPINMKINGQNYIFPNAEAAFQAGKFKKNKTFLQQLTKVQSGYEAWDLARKSNALSPKNWFKQDATGLEGREVWMGKVVLAKFTQNQVLSQQLKNTGNLILKEASPYDNQWGIGASWQNGPQGIGQNKLGDILMDVRTQI